MIEKHLNTTVIQYPEPNFNYLIRINGLREVRVIFSGNIFSKFKSFDVSSGIYLEKNSAIPKVYEFKNLKFISHTALPNLIAKKCISPILISFGNKANVLVEISSIDFTEHQGAVFANFNCNDGQKIRTVEHQAGSIYKGVPISVGKFPIFQTSWSPRYDYLHLLFKEFLAFNSWQKLLEQASATKDLCHVRAHFVFEMLRSYNINVIKLFKKFNHIDWQNFNVDHTHWSFHCSAAIVDSSDRCWVWDPWVYKSKVLIPIEEWLVRSDEPKPTSLIITNGAVVSDLSGSMVDATNFLVFAGEKQKIAFQYLITTALPKSPECSLIALKHMLKFLLKYTDTKKPQEYFLGF